LERGREDGKVQADHEGNHLKEKVDENLGGLRAFLSRKKGKQGTGGRGQKKGWETIVSLKKQ